jgi:hypothetical protein
MPTKSCPADHPGRRNHDRPGHNHDTFAFVGIALTIPATVEATAATFRGLRTEACETQQRGECGNRKNFSAHRLGLPVFAAKVISPPSLLISR